MVAGMDLRLDWLRDLGNLHLHDRTDWGYISYLVSGRESSLFRYLGVVVASLQQSCHGLYMVRRSVVDRRYGLQASALLLKDAYFSQGECVTLMIRSIWTAYKDVPNSLPASSGTDTMDFVSFFLFWICSLPAIWFPVHKIRHLFTIKAYFVPPAGIAFFIWAIVRAHGIGPIVHQPAAKSGGALGWAVIQGIMSSIANFATLIVNDPDFARFAKKPRDALWSQFITIPVGFAATSFIGIIVSSSSAVIYGKPIWNPLELLGYFLINPNNGDTANGAARFGVFIISFAFALAQLGTNIAANSVSAGTDMTALLPRYLNIRRGGYICAAVGLAMCPW